MVSLNRKRIVFIPVRKGSKGIVGKNLKILYDKPLISWILQTFKNNKIADEIWIATDCNKMYSHIRNNFPKVKIYKRTEKNAQDSSPTIDVVMEFLNKQRFSKGTSFMIAQATVPFTTANDFANGFRYFEESKYDSLISCVNIKSFVWDENGTCLSYKIDDKPRRQDFKGTLLESGAFYISRTDTIWENKSFIFGNIGIYNIDSRYWIDIDEQIDWEIAELMVKFQN